MTTRQEPEPVTIALVPASTEEPKQDMPGVPLWALVLLWVALAVAAAYVAGVRLKRERRRDP